MFALVGRLLAMIRFSHTIFALPFAILAALMAWNTPLPEDRYAEFRVRDLLGILLCMVFARSAAMAFNRIADRDIDAENPRTRNRHLPSGSLSLTTVAAFTAVSSLGFIASTAMFFPNRLPLWCSAPVLIVLLTYSYTKRFTWMAHFWLGLSLMLAPMAAWVAIRGEILLTDPLDALPSLILGIAVLLWVSGFDMLYACQDTAFDVSAGLHSVPARFGVRNALWLAATCHFGMVVVLICLPLMCPQLGFGWIYATGITAVALLLVIEHWLVNPDDLTKVNVAFFHVNSVVSVGLLVIGAVDLYW